MPSHDEVSTKGGGVKKAWFEVPSGFVPFTPGGTQWDQYVRSIGMALMDRLGQEHVFSTGFWVTKSIDYTLIDTDDSVGFSAAGAARIATLPTVVGRKGKRFFIQKTDSSANLVTITPAGGQTIGGAATVTLDQQYSGAWIEGDGTSDWHILALVGPTSATVIAWNQAQNILANQIFGG